MSGGPLRGEAGVAALPMKCAPWRVGVWEGVGGGFRVQAVSHEVYQLAVAFAPHGLAYEVCALQRGRVMVPGFRVWVVGL